jgi:hypothetical protein
MWKNRSSSIFHEKRFKKTVLLFIHVILVVGKVKKVVGFMHMKVPFLAVFSITIFQVVTLAILSYEEINELLMINPNQVDKIEITDYSNEVHTMKDPEKISDLLDYLNQFEYQRLVGDETSYMPMNTILITIYDGETSDFIIPYRQEALISHKVYKIRNGPIDPDVILRMIN